MSVARVLDEYKAKNTAALIGYLPIGYPSFEKSVEAAKVLIENGVDIVELGVPYSDPVLDGSTIQIAVDRALRGGFKLKQTFQAVSEVAKTGAPVLVMSYYNPIYKYGVEKFAADLKRSGGSGIITADLIPEEAQDWIAAADRNDLDKVFLVAPSSTRERLELTAAAARGFVYATSTMGVTGLRSTLNEGVADLISRTRDSGAERVCVGVGVSNPEQAHIVAKSADGVIVGSAFVKILLQDKPWEEVLADLAKLTQELAQGVAAGGADR